MTNDAPSTSKWLWLASAALVLAASAGAGSLLLSYGGPLHRHQTPAYQPENGSSAAQATIVLRAPAAHSTPPQAAAQPSEPVQANDPQAFIDQHFPYQVIAEVKAKPTPAEAESQVRAAFPDYGKLLDNKRANDPAPAPVTAATDRGSLPDSER